MSEEDPRSADGTERRQMARRSTDQPRSTEPPRLDDKVMPSLAPCSDDIASRQGGRGQTKNRHARQRTVEAGHKSDNRASKRGRSSSSSRSPDRWVMVLIAFCMVSTTAGLFVQNQGLQKQIRAQADQIVESKEKLGSLDKAVSSTGSELDKSETLFEKRLSALESSIEKVKNANQRIAPDVSKNREAIEKLEKQSKKIGSLSDQVESYDKKIASVDASVRKQAEETIKVTKMTEGITDQLTKQIEERTTKLQADVTGFSLRLESITESISLMGESVKGAEEDLMVLEEALNNGLSQDAIDALELKLLTSVAELEKQLDAQERVNQAVNLFRRQTNTAIEQINTDVRRLKSGVPGGVSSELQVPSESYQSPRY